MRCRWSHTLGELQSHEGDAETYQEVGGHHDFPHGKWGRCSGEDRGHIGAECVCVWRGCCWKDRREREWVPVLEKMLCDLQKWGEDRELRIYMIFFLSLEKLSHTSLMWISHHNRKWEPASPIISRNLSFQRALNCRVLVIEKDVVSRVKNTCFGFVANKPYSVLVVYNKIRSLDLYKGRGGA